MTVFGHVTVKSFRNVENRNVDQVYKFGLRLCQDIFFEVTGVSGERFGAWFSE